MSTARILVVDDEADIRELVKEILNADSFDCIEAGIGTIEIEDGFPVPFELLRVRFLLD